MRRFLVQLLSTLLVGGCMAAVDPVMESRKLDIIKNAHMGYRLGIDIREAMVTYVVEGGSDPVNDPPGFFIQAHPQGTALFLPFGPDEFSPYPKAGDVITMKVVEVLDQELWMSAALWEPVEGSEEEAIRPLNSTRWLTHEEVSGLRSYLEKEDPDMLTHVSGLFNGRVAIIDYRVLRTDGVEHLVTDVTSDQGLTRNVDPYADRLLTISGVIRLIFIPTVRTFVRPCWA